jgi:hypothetical protein
MRKSTWMMMGSTAWILERHAVDGAGLAMTITMLTARVWRTCRLVRKGPDKGWEQKMGLGKGRQLRMGWGKASRRGLETVKGKVMVNSIRQTRTQRLN